MKEVCNSVTPPSPLFFVSVDFRGFRVAVSCLESISLELIDSIRGWRVSLGRFPGTVALQRTQHYSTCSK